MQEQAKSQSSNKTIEPIVQLIVFRAGDEEFGVPIDVVREIIKLGPITPIPNSSRFIKGIMNVRGEIVITIDIKSRFSLRTKKSIESKHIIVTRQEDNLFGLIVDEVSEVLRIRKTDINATPSLITKVNEEYIDGVVTQGIRLIVVLNLGKMLSQSELVKFAHYVHNKKEI